MRMKYKITDVTKDFYGYDWFYIFPSIEVRHKYWYLWEIRFSWFGWYKYFEIINKNWNKKKESQLRPSFLFKILNLEFLIYEK